MDADFLPRRTPPASPEARWPRWAGIVLVLAGVVVVVAETSSLLLVVGALFVALGAYSLRRGWSTKHVRASPSTD